MNYGFIIEYKGGKTAEYEKYYMNKREELFGYVQNALPEAVTPLEPDLETPEIRRIHLRNAAYGLLSSYDQAVTMLDELKKEFGDIPLEIVRIEYEDATSIQWYTKDGIEDNLED